MFDRHTAVDVVGAEGAGGGVGRGGGAGAASSKEPDNNNHWSQSAADRLSVCGGAGRAALLRSHAARSADCGGGGGAGGGGGDVTGGGGSPRSARRAPRESRRVSVAHAHGYVQLNQYRLLEPIGQGSYGIVKLAYNEEDETHYAMKILSKRKLVRRAGLFGRAPPPRRLSTAAALAAPPATPPPATPPSSTPPTATAPSAPPPAPASRAAGPPVPPSDPLHRVYREIAVLKKLDHPNVVKLVEVLDDPAEDQLYLVFQLLEGGPVLDVPTDNPLTEEVARQYFCDALLGIEYLHYQRIVHRDIKPANLLLCAEGAGGSGGWRVQVADLGVCDEVRDHHARLSGAVGTPAFRAPEALASHDSFDGKAADIWSLGVTLYSLVTGAVPWTGGGGGAAALQQHAARAPLTFPPPPATQLSAPLRDLVARMLDKDPATRIKMADIKTHPWTTLGGTRPLPSEEENCRLVEVTEEDLARVVTSIPNLSTLILIKTMLKNHSFQNPFLRSREGSSARGGGSQDSGGEAAVPATASGRARPHRPGLARSGRSVSAPGSYLTDAQPSFDAALASVRERDSVDPEPESGADASHR